ncbi:septum formation family protein [Pseudactinotalea sp.]|uniref:septum formation family protein n=1 Tax=Pseudactinotalea sp. TaxID=1926260 RepID=UPI003B3A02F4
MPGARPRRASAAVALACALALAGCSSLNGDDGSGTSVFDLVPGMCVLAPSHEEVSVELAAVTTVPCEDPHELEVFALVEYPEPTDSATQAGSSFPGDAMLKDFADGACVGAFAEYVGVDYRDSELFFTYLVPSARSWQAEDDRTVLCLITTTGEQLTQSVAGTGW